MMVASRGSVPRFARDLVGDSSVTEQRPQRRSARNVVQSGDAGDKKLLRSKSKRSGKSTKVSTGIGEVGDDGIGEGIDGGIGERVEGEIEGRVVDETVRCLCSRRVEEGEMVCCDVCQRWSHLRCIGMKEDVGVMEGKEFVCYFCLSTCLLALRKEVGELRKELHLTKMEMKGLREENGKLRDQNEHDRPEEVRGVQKEVVKDMTRGERVVGDEAMSGEVVNNKESGEKKAPSVGRQRCDMKEPKRATKWVAGARKVWGTRKKESCDEIAKEMVRVGGKVEPGFSVQKRVGQVNGKDGWWFIVKAPEKNLIKVDKVWQHKHWRWQRIQGGRNDF